MLSPAAFPLPRRFARTGALRRLGGSLTLLALIAGGAAPLAGQAPPPEPVAAVAAEREEALLGAVLRYLQLSRTQLIRMHGLARQVERRLALLPPAAEGQPPASPFDRELSREETEAVRGGAAYLTQFLMRQQIGLAWKLEQGTPPAWTGPEPALLNGVAGFGRGLGGPKGVSRFETGSELLLLEQAHAADEARRELLLLEQAHAADEARAVEMKLEVTGRLTDRLGVRLLRQIERPSEHPFPQRLAETAHPVELAPEIEPFTRRLLLSDRLVPVLEGMLTGRIRPPESVRPRVPSGAPRVLRDYRMARGFGDLSGHGPELFPLGGVLRSGVYAFGAGQGLQCADLGVTDHYSVQTVLRWLGGDDYQKLIDFKEGGKDTGLYTYQGHFTFYTMADGGAPVPGQEHRLVLERHRSTRLVRAFVDFRPIFSFIDLDDEAVFGDGKASFFLDDRGTQQEQGPGTLRWLLVYNGPLSR